MKGQGVRVAEICAPDNKWVRPVQVCAHNSTLTAPVSIVKVPKNTKMHLRKC